MKDKQEKSKTPPKTDKKKSHPVLNDIIKKIVDTHATADQALAEISHSCNSHKDCEGK